jgi:hypothetical protein
VPQQPPQGREAEEELESAPADEQLNEQAEALAAIITEACH